MRRGQGEPCPYEAERRNEIPAPAGKLKAGGLRSAEGNRLFMTTFMAEEHGGPMEDIGPYNKTKSRIGGCGL